MSGMPESSRAAHKGDRDLQRFDGMLSRAEWRGFSSLSVEEVEEFPKLYRQALTLLEHAREHRLDRSLIDRLSNLTSRAALVLRKPSGSFWVWLVKALGVELPQALWRERWFLAAGVITSLVGLLFGWWALSLNPELRDVLIPEKISSLAVKNNNPLDAFMELLENIERLIGGNIDNRQIQIFVTTIKSMALIVGAGLLFGFPSLAFGFIFSAMAGAMAAYELTTKSVIFGADYLVGCVGLLVVASAFASTAGLIVGSGLWRNGSARRPGMSQRIPIAIVFVGWGIISAILLLGALIQSFPMVPKVVHPMVLFVAPIGVFSALLVWGGISQRLGWGGER